VGAKTGIPSRSNGVLRVLLRCLIATGIMAPLVLAQTACVVSDDSIRQRFCSDYPGKCVAVDSISPGTGPVAGGVPVIIRGARFPAELEATLGGAALLDLVVVDEKTITGKAPTGRLGLAEVVVTAGGGSVTLPSAFEYLCEPGWVYCDGACVDPGSDRAHCGASGDCLGSSAGNRCGAGEVCSTGQCGLSCRNGAVRCGGQCENPMTSVSHCGASGDCVANPGAVCAPGDRCSNGLCCASGLLACQGWCVDPKRDSVYCGATGECMGPSAGVTCATPEACYSGACADSEWANWLIPADVYPSQSYTVAADTVTDRTTGLVWQRAAAVDGKVWAAAKSYCSGLVLAGTTGWRLPSQVELTSIVEFGAFAPTIDEKAFPAATPGDGPGAYWTSTPMGSSEARRVLFRSGESDSAPTSSLAFVRCVR
jgi:Protein of unknown function (DUF1566)/IPT/TIG domain